ncbi:MAG TPA: AAC(3)-I family aminoglycoside N-acetyltransferase [Oscillatoriales cyanobacterium M59_W2019_021]|nr:MAG: AAC(3)-I family aminoglycoside N-acetyltransferase [Cyanobacteria bacterium J055]HIK33419.1 AAC(3)-I family aminoglycoside N-acetyltransferase [Oscillatoriales cyanobacterium M4454_W2019_049]HIK49844.1 AAC(3)-I family aminoglycoside N-acetyltransferase [Oscillatoriales cyanobacterium M59_W2019_021]
MSSTENIAIQHLCDRDINLMRDLLRVFGDAFEDADTYGNAPPTTEYLRQLLSREHFIVLVALKYGEVVGGLAAYELQKFERERSEIYMYDLAVSAAHRRQGIATKLIDELKTIARTRGVYVIFVQADYGDTPAIELYTKMGVREEVLHFDIGV